VRAWVCTLLVLLAASTQAFAAGDLLADAKSGDTSAAIALIDHGADVNVPSSDGTTALMWAVHRDDVALVDRLLKAHADVKTVNSYGATALTEAAVYGDTGVIKKLLSAGADANVAGADGQTPLMIVARTSNVDAAEALVKHGAKVNTHEQWRNQTALIWASAESQPAMVKFLLKHDAEVDARTTVNTGVRQVTSEPRVQARPSGGLTALLYATRQGCGDCVRFLVEHKANVNLTDPDGVTPLIMAIQNFHFDVAAYLIEKGADVNKWDWWGRAPLYSAVDVNTVPFGGRPDRISLDATTSLKLIETLLKAGANPNAQLKLFPPYRALGPDRGGDQMLTIGTTPLLRAAKAGDAAAVRLLLAHGANLELPNNSGITPLLAAAGIGTNDIDTRGHFKTSQQATETIQLLLAAGADVKARDSLGRSVLHGAAFWGWNDAIKALAAGGADVNAKDNKGMTPIDSAMGRAGGHGRGNNSPEVHQESATLLEQLARNTPSSAPTALQQAQRPQ
jgi:ankyrin repeat protein